MREAERVLGLDSGATEVTLAHYNERYKAHRLRIERRMAQHGPDGWLRSQVRRRYKRLHPLSWHVFVCRPAAAARCALVTVLGRVAAWAAGEPSALRGVAMRERRFRRTPGVRALYCDPTADVDAIAGAFWSGI